MQSNLIIHQLEWQQKPDRWWWVCDNHPLGECWIKLYDGSVGYYLYAPGFRGVGNNFASPEAAMMVAQGYLDDFVKKLVRVEPIRYYQPENGATITEFKEGARNSDLYRTGDITLVAVNKSDLMFMERVKENGK
jgi:hypothetical protein